MVGPATSQAATVVRLDGRRIVDWTTFHQVFAETFGFPDFYGRNMDAWIDCMSYLDDPPSGMSSINVRSGGVMVLHLEGADDFATRCPEQYKALMDCTAFVNLRQRDKGLPPLLALALDR